MSLICKRFYISGKVQGVWFRANTQQQAEQLNITGYAKNLADQRVEVVACGETAKLQLLEQWLHKGPPLAEVESVTIEEIALENYQSFSIK